ncbi:carbohydrate-binding protein [Streptomyces sp. NPDC047072]|uniref:fibronectin type III domain-containing protein n=1 Tax=Streptomyces sp. NPDC047072 TaxID=3154809 RepID=UPI00340B154F
MQRVVKRSLISVAAVGAVLGVIAAYQGDFGDDQQLSAAEGVATTGKMTFYQMVGTGSCGTHLDATTEDLVALPPQLWTTGNPNNDPICNASVEVTYNGKTLTLPVRDKCLDCTADHIDLSRHAFQQLADLDVGVVNGITWKVISAGGEAIPSGDTQAPTVPTGTTIDAWTDTSLAVTWAPATDNVGVTGYDLYADGVKIYTGTATRVIVSGVAKSKTYKFTVAARDAAGNVSAQSTPLDSGFSFNSASGTHGSVDSKGADTAVIGTAVTDTAPGKPGTPTRTGWTADTVGLAWDDSEDDKGTNGYYLYVDGVRVADTLVHRVVVKGLTKGKAYKFAVQGHDVAGNVSPMSDPVEVTLTGDTSGSVDPLGGDTADLTNTGANGTAGPTGGPTGTATATASASASPDTCGTVWSGSQAYVPGDLVSYQGHKYKATYYANGAVPGDPTSWAVWHDEGACG